VKVIYRFILILTVQMTLYCVRRIGLQCYRFLFITVLTSAYTDSYWLNFISYGRHGCKLWIC